MKLNKMISTKQSCTRNAQNKHLIAGCINTESVKKSNVKKKHNSSITNKSKNSNEKIHKIST